MEGETLGFGEWLSVSLVKYSKSKLSSMFVGAEVMAASEVSSVFAYLSSQPTITTSYQIQIDH